MRLEVGLRMYVCDSESKRPVFERNRERNEKNKGKGVWCENTNNLSQRRVRGPRHAHGATKGRRSAEVGTKRKRTINILAKLSESSPVKEVSEASMCSAKLVHLDGINSHATLFWIYRP